MSALLLLACTGSGELPARGGLPAGGDRPDVILLSVDTLRADHVGVYGYARPTTPTIDALAAKGVRFAHARAPSPWTLPSHATMLTGLLPSRHHLVDDGLRLGEALRLLPEAMAEAGYATGGFVASVFVGKSFGFDAGSQTFEDFGLVGKRENLKGLVDAAQVVDAALAFTAAHPGEAVSLFLHVYDLHYPYDAPAPYNAAFDPAREPTRYKTYAWHKKHPLTPAQLQAERDAYDEELRYVDAQLARLLEAFEAAERDPIVAVSADHGEEFGERGSWGHGHTLNPEQLRVPMVLAGPGLPAGVVVEQAVGLQDLAPTLAALAGASLPEVDGRSLLPEARGEATPPRAFPSDTSRFDTNRLGLWQDGLRLDWDLRSDSAALYADPGELEDVAEARPEDVRRLKEAALAAWGPNWMAAPGQLTTRGRIWVGTRYEGGAVGLTESSPLTILPVDAEVFHDGGGPYRLTDAPAAEGAETAPLTPLRASALDPAQLSPEARARLEALGYIQGEEDP